MAAHLLAIRNPRPLELVLREVCIYACLDALQPAVNVVEPCFDTIHR